MADRRLAWALAAVIVRYLATIQPHASRELARWRRRALSIPDPELRAHVLRPFDADLSAVGASIFAVLAPWPQQPGLVRLLVAYVLLWSYVDVRTERDAAADPRLYDALLDALPSGRSARTSLSLDDGGYLCALVTECRRRVVALPSWPAVAPIALLVADDGRAVQAINHGPASAVVERLRAWARAQAGVPWPEACAAASSPLAIHALMALAAHREVGGHEARVTASAYQPVSALGVLCDHLIDHAEDGALSNHSYLPHLGSLTARPRVLQDLADRAARAVRRLPDGERHTVIVAAMAAMFLSRPAASRPANRAAAGAILEAIGSPAPQLRTVLRARRQLKRPAR